MHLHGLNIINSNESSITIDNDIDVELNFENALAFPGLVNSHDHLDFNLFPQLGSRTYNNYTEWGANIHQQYKNEIAEVLKVPKAIRTQWGVYKNLLAGVTTVVNHGEKLEIVDPLITVIQDTNSLHSVKFEKYWKLKLFSPLKSEVINIHLGEGTDEASRKEIDQFIRWNIFKKKTVAIHGVAMTPEQAKHFEALVWCPESNYFLLNKTAPIKNLKSKIKILFGTDSTLTAPWNIWEHLRTARKTNELNDVDLMNTVFSAFSAVKKNLVIAKASSFFDINPQDILLILHQNQVRLFDESLLPQLSTTTFPLDNYKKVYLNNSKYVQGNITGLVADIRRILPNANLPV
ncbi:MAG TPA: hypothetical protein VJT83_09375 [Chitinophagaceae bacterium]|nr:hypothetical protein [Chitinophagaceae bacterium]